MAYEEVKPKPLEETSSFNAEGQVVEGKLLEIREDIGKNHSNVYVIETKEGLKNFWGANALDPLMDNVSAGSKVKITVLSMTHKFPNGRVGKNFKVEVDK